MNETLRRRLVRMQRLTLISGLIGLAAAGLGAWLSAAEFFRGYLFGYLFWLGLGLGCLAVVMIHHLTGGGWGFVTRRFLEAGMMTLPLMLFLFVPLFFGLGDLYPWARRAEVAANPLLQKKAIYLNAPGFIGRTLFFFVIWLTLAWLLRRWSALQDRIQNPGPTRRLRALSGPGLVIYPLTATFAYVDWVTSLEPQWHSTMFPLIVLIGQVLTSFSFATLWLVYFKAIQPLAGAVTLKHFHDLGNLLLTFVMFWTYVAFGQFLVIYSGNLPHEIAWYLRRIAGGWKWVLAALALVHFFLPFFLLLFRVMKQRTPHLVKIAGAIFAIHIVEVFWMVMPSFEAGGVGWKTLGSSAASFVGIGGLWLAMFFFSLQKYSLLPRNDPRIQQLLAHAE